jgi:hypothetical protein
MQRQRQEHYKGFIIAWWEPHQTSGEWTVTIEPGDLGSFDKFGQTLEVSGSTLDAAIDKAKRFIDGL